MLELLDSTNTEMKSLANERNLLKSKLETILSSQNFMESNGVSKEEFKHQ